MNIILDIIIVLLVAKLLGGLFIRLKMVELLGAIVAGIILGPILNIVDISNIEHFGKIGLILVLFLAGFTEFNLKKILREKAGIFYTGILGGVIPFICGTILGLLFNFSTIESLFIGAIMAATSVSISVGTMINLNKVNTKVGRYTITSGIIDDLVGIVILIIILSIAITGTFSFLETSIALLKIVIFAALFLILLYIMPKLFNLIFKIRASEIEISIALVIILSLAYISENLGLSSIIGAFLAGVILSKVRGLKTNVEIEKFEAIGMGVFIPFFFVWVGMQLTLDISLISWFTLAFVLTAIFGKILAAYISGTIAKMTNIEKLSLGIATIPRGEVALSIILMGSGIGLVNQMVFGSTLILVLVTVILTPLLLRPLLVHIQD